MALKINGLIVQESFVVRRVAWNTPPSTCHTLICGKTTMGDTANEMKFPEKTSDKVHDTCTKFKHTFSVYHWNFRPNFTNVIYRTNSERNSLKHEFTTAVFPIQREWISLMKWKEWWFFFFEWTEIDFVRT